MKTIVFISMKSLLLRFHKISPLSLILWKRHTPEATTKSLHMNPLAPLCSNFQDCWIKKLKNTPPPSCSLPIAIEVITEKIQSAHMYTQTHTKGEQLDIYLHTIALGRCAKFPHSVSRLQHSTQFIWCQCMCRMFLPLRFCRWPEIKHWKNQSTMQHQASTNDSRNAAPPLPSLPTPQAQ